MKKIFFIATILALSLLIAACEQVGPRKAAGFPTGHEHQSL